MRIKEGEMQERRKELIRVAFSMFCEKGIDAVKLKDVGKTAHIGEATLYRYFGNKENLVLEAFIELWDMMMDTVYHHVTDSPIYESLSGYEQITAWIEGFKYLFEEAADYVLFSYEAKLYLVRHEIKLNKHNQDALMYLWRKSCVAALDKGKKDGSICAQRDSEDLFFSIWGSIRGFVTKIVIYDRLYDGQSPWKSRYNILCEGILCALKSNW